MAAVPVNAAELDKMILNYSILNGALELLPQSLASMAIIPLQMKMVYRVGKAHGFELDRGHIKDLLATMGVGLTSQYVEQIGRKLIGGLLGRIGGGLLGRHGQRDDRRRLLLRVHLRAGSRGEALLRRRPHDRRGRSAAGVHVDAGRGEAIAGQVHGADRRAGAHAGREQAAVGVRDPRFPPAAAEWSGVASSHRLSPFFGLWCSIALRGRP